MDEPSKVAKVVVYRDEAGEYRWRGVAGNGEPVASGEGYVNRADAAAIAANLFPDAEIVAGPSSVFPGGEIEDEA